MNYIYFHSYMKICLKLSFRTVKIQKLVRQKKLYMRKCETNLNLTYDVLRFTKNI